MSDDLAQDEPPAEQPLREILNSMVVALGGVLNTADPIERYYVDAKFHATCYAAAEVARRHALEQVAAREAEIMAAWSAMADSDETPIYEWGAVGLDKFVRSIIQGDDQEPAIDPECAKRFGVDGEYDPSCCRFPKACSPFRQGDDQTGDET